MEAGELLGTVAFAVTIAVLVSASVSDWRDREVPDWHWIVIGVLGLIIMLAYSVLQTGFRWEYVCLAIGTSLILFDIFADRDFDPFLFYFTMALLFIVPLYSDTSDQIMRAWASIPVCYLIYLGMYVLGIVRGGADVKCLIVLSVMFPLYPRFLGMPLIDVPGNIAGQIFVYSVSVLFLAAVATIPVILYFVARNIRNGDRSRKMFSGYRMSVNRAEGANVWPTEDVVDGKLKTISIPDEEEMDGIYARLKEEGYDTVWVTPMIPFIIMITAAVAVVTLIGNPLFLIF
ncbi:MAG: hypothetical protein LBU30_02650 [Candidatus Methanoplasma sp.]|jgi:preflagellin peptidase FlaK|nr:hypothetical protein [Candidatus Methanoplasma sp.]